MEEDFLFYALFKDEMSGTFDDGFRGRLDLVYAYSQEVSEIGTPFDRAVKRGQPEELIVGTLTVYRFNLN
jgi:hypothetical protein